MQVATVGAMRGGQVIALSPKALALRHEPMRHPGQALTRTHPVVADGQAVATELSRHA